MNLKPAIKWLDDFDRWKASEIRKHPKTGITRLTERPEKYLRLVQANALRWCVGKSENVIRKKIERILNGQI